MVTRWRSVSTSEPAELVIDGRHVCDATVANTRNLRRRGLIGRDNFDGALVIPCCRWIHTFGMRFAIDVVYLDDRGRVLKFATVYPNRLTKPILNATSVVEAPSGRLCAMSIGIGTVIEVHGRDWYHST